MIISVVIPSFNNSDLLKKLLDQLREINEFKQLTIVVVDNGSSDGTSNMVRQKYPEVDLITLAENSGGSGGFITGVNHAMTLNVDYIWMLDDDVVIKNDTLSALLKAAVKLDQDGVKWGAIGSMMANLDNPLFVVETGAEVDWMRGRFRLYNHNERIKNIKPEIKRVEYCAAASLLSRPEIIRDVGFFENVFIHFDDVEWCLRMNKLGYGVYCNTASIFWHTTIKEDPSTWVRYYDTRNFLWLCRKCNRKWLYWGILRMVIKGLYFKLHRMPAIARLYKLGMIDAFTGKLRMRKNLEIEEIIDIDDILPELRSRDIIGVFRNCSNLNIFRKLHPNIMDNVKKVFFYERIRVPISCRKYLKLIKLWTLLKSSLYMFLHSKSLVVFDGNCYHGLMFPPLRNDTIYVFLRHRKAIRRMRGKE